MPAWPVCSRSPSHVCAICSAAFADGPVGADPHSTFPVNQLPPSCNQPTSAACLDASVGFLDPARAGLGQEPYQLPADFASLTPQIQQFVLTRRLLSARLHLHLQSGGPRRGRHQVGRGAGGVGNSSGGATGSGTGADSPPPASKRVTVTITVHGPGAVIDPAGHSCHNATCSFAETAGHAVRLVAQTDGRTTFTGWSGQCSGAAKSCTLTPAGTGAAVGTGFHQPQARISRRHARGRHSRGRHARHRATHIRAARRAR